MVSLEVGRGIFENEDTFLSFFFLLRLTTYRALVLYVAIIFKGYAKKYMIDHI